MKPRLTKVILTGCVVFIGFSTNCLATETAVDSITLSGTLGEVVIEGAASLQKESVNAETIDRHEKRSIAEALNLLPGVLNVKGSKSDQVYVRGFNQKQVPVYYDGVPIYVPYDGTLDLSMLMAADVSKISVVKGAGTMLYGPNALGGAINIVTAAPAKGFSFKAKAGTFTEGKYTALASAGYATDLFYARVAYAVVDENDYRLPADYVPTKSIEDGGSLDNSWVKTAQLAAKIGWTPAEGHEYVFSYVKHDGSKGMPPYLGSNGSSRFWQFPIYDKESYYWLSESKLSAALSLKTRVYYDKFDNTLESYDDTTYTTQTKRYAFTSIYDDYSYGAIATLSRITGNNTTLFDVQYKYDDHKEHNVGDSVVRMTDQSGAISLVDLYRLGKVLFQGGVSFTWQKGLNAEYLDQNDAIASYPKNSANAWNGELTVTLPVSSTDVARAGLSYKTRFPTMKDRYSQSFGKSIPNPFLVDENSLNATLDYTGSYFNGRVKADAGVFYSSLKNAILSVYGVDETDPSIYQYQNTGKAEYYGADVVISCNLMKSLDLQTNYSFVKRNNLSNPEDKFTGVPEHSFQADLIYDFSNGSYIDLNAEAYSSRYGTSDGTRVDGFSLFNLKAGCQLWKKHVSLEAGVNNLLDANYQVSEGLPMPGRNAYTSIVYTF